MRHMRAIPLLSGLLLLLAAGCGQKGELYLEPAQAPPAELGQQDEQPDDERDDG